MDINYLKDQIEDEISGYEDYLNKAESCPEYGDTLRSMAEQEMSHAKNLMKILKQKIDDAESVYKQFEERIH